MSLSLVTAAGPSPDYVQGNKDKASMLIKFSSNIPPHHLTEERSVVLSVIVIMRIVRVIVRMIMMIIS